MRICFAWLRGERKDGGVLGRLLKRTAELVEKGKPKVPPQNLANALWVPGELETHMVTWLLRRWSAWA